MSMSTEQSTRIWDLTIIVGLVVALSAAMFVAFISKGPFPLSIPHTQQVRRISCICLGLEEPDQQHGVAPKPS